MKKPFFENQSPVDDRLRSILADAVSERKSLNLACPQEPQIGLYIQVEGESACAGDDGIKIDFFELCEPEEETTRKLRGLASQILCLCDGDEKTTVDVMIGTHQLTESQLQRCRDKGQEAPRILGELRACQKITCA